MSSHPKELISYLPWIAIWERTQASSNTLASTLAQVLTCTLKTFAPCTNIRLDRLTHFQRTFFLLQCLIVLCFFWLNTLSGERGAPSWAVPYGLLSSKFQLRFFFFVMSCGKPLRVFEVDLFSSSRSRLLAWELLERYGKISHQVNATTTTRENDENTLRKSDQACSAWHTVKFPVR